MSEDNCPELKDSDAIDNMKCRFCDSDCKLGKSICPGCWKDLKKDSPEKCRFDRIWDIYCENYKTFVEKNKDYGNSFIKTAVKIWIYNNGEGFEINDFSDLVAFLVYLRDSDKDCRKQNFLLSDRESDEGLEDAFQDSINYNGMALDVVRENMDFEEALSRLME